MTATMVPPTRPPSDSSDDSLLRVAVRADATVCAGLGLLLAMAADPLSRLSGLSAASEWLAGAALVGYGVALYVMAAVPFVRRIGVGIVVANVVFAVVVVVVLAAGLLPLTGMGEAMMLATVAATLGLAYLQYLGVRRLA
jgi:threonine/homoserine/homoserine lactone efflux protein